MATITIDERTVAVRFTTAEKIGGLLRDQVFDREAITAAEHVPDGLAATKGMRAPGLALPWRRRIGTWRSRRGKELVSVRRGEPAVRLHLTGGRWASLLIGHPDAAAVAAALSVEPTEA
jgi:hypothetical protein